MESQDQKTTREAAELMQQLVDEGKLVETGWAVASALIVPAEASLAQLKELRKAFYLGADHLFCSMLIMLSAGDQGEDFRRMRNIQRELEIFRKQFKRINKH